MKLKPLEDRVVIKAVEEEEKTASGIVLPDTAKEKPTMGEVVAVGDGKWDEDGKKRIPVDVKIGDKVIYGKYSGTEYKTPTVRNCSSCAPARSSLSSEK